MEHLFKKFPHIKEKMIINLDDKTLANLNQSSRKLNLIQGKSWWIKIIQKYIGDEKDYQVVWKEFLTQTPTKIVKQLGNIIQEFFTKNEKIWLMNTLSPLHFAANCGNLDLCEYIYSKTGIINPKTEEGTTPFQQRV